MQTAVVPAAEKDHDIAALLQSGEHDRAFNAIVQRYEGKVYRLCYALLRETMQAEEAAQESLVRVWKALDTYDGRASLSTWIYAVTRDRCMTALERRRAFESLSDRDVEAEVLNIVGQDTQDSDERSRLLRELIDRLPERLRRTLLLFYFEDRSVSEVAEMLGCPEGIVKTNLFRARAALTEQLHRRGLGDPVHWLEMNS